MEENKFKKELLHWLYEANIQETKAIWSLVKEFKMENEQEALDWLDTLNEISVQN